MGRIRRIVTGSGILAVITLCAVVSLVQAQQGNDGGRRRGDRGEGSAQRGQFDPEQFRVRMMDNMKQDLAVSEEDWKVVEPLLTDVMEKQRESMGGFRDFGFMMRSSRPDNAPGGREDRPRGPGAPSRSDIASATAAPGGPGGPGGPPMMGVAGGPGGPDRGRFGMAPNPEVDALREALNSENTSAKDIKAKLDDLRKARKAKEKALQDSREALRKVLSVRQEAQLVLRGILD